MPLIKVQVIYHITVVVAARPRHALPLPVVPRPGLRRAAGGAGPAVAVFVAPAHEDALIDFDLLTTAGMAASYAFWYAVRAGVEWPGNYDFSNLV